MSTNVYSRRRVPAVTVEEIVVLRRFVGIDNDTQVKASSVKMEIDWQDLNLSERSKASLSTNCHDINTNAPIPRPIEDQTQSQKY